MNILLHYRAETFTAPLRATARRFRHRPLAIAASLLVTSTALANTAPVPDADTPARPQRHDRDATTGNDRQYAIPAGPLGKVLARFALESRILLTNDAAMIQGKLSPGIQGRHAPQEALQQALAGTGLEALPLENGHFIIEPLTQSEALPEIAVTAETVLKQSLGVSLITKEDLERRPPANDLSELIRTQPGVNLSSASSSGSYGNNRQIDLRGMGPENTMIMIDGKPVQSKNAVRMQRNGERDSRGDSNWVPADAIDSIEVIRGPAAARYGSGAAGGVVNIITRKPTRELSGSVTAYYSVPEESLEGSTRRIGFTATGPLSDNLSMRVYGNVAKTDADAPGINAAASGVAATESTLPPAGREGVRNRDINALMRWDINPDHVVELEVGASRQGNIYTGERPVSANGTALEASLAEEGAETNITHRNTASLTHRGKWEGLGTSRLLFQYEGTRRQNYPLTQFGAGGDVASTDMIKSALQNYFLNGELYTPLQFGGMRHMLTSGIEWRREHLDDPNAMSATSTNGTITVPGLPATGNRSPEASDRTFALYFEDNIAAGQSLVLTPGLRIDHHSKFGVNLSPSLNAMFELTPQVTLKGGIARAFKAPNIYQSNPNYLFYSQGNACTKPDGSRPNGCYIQGNADLEPETSVNSEAGIGYDNHLGLQASLVYFHNHYNNKIHADIWDQSATTIAGGSNHGTAGASGELYRWVNAKRALVRGFEGNLTVPLLGQAGRDLQLINNLTYMIENRNTETGQPLSIIPKYTVNSTLDWKYSDRASWQLTATFYGKQEARTLSSGYGLPVTGAQANDVGAYSIYGLSTTFNFNKAWRLGAGVKNLFDKRLYRASTSDGGGAATYNEAGRSFYATVTMLF